MTFTELRYATVLAKTQHFGRAAELCNVSQPTLSIAIKSLNLSLASKFLSEQPIKYLSRK